jgi:hypothetical protein
MSNSETSIAAALRLLTEVWLAAYLGPVTGRRRGWHIKLNAFVCAPNRSQVDLLESIEILLCSEVKQQVLARAFWPPRSNQKAMPLRIQHFPPLL